MYECKKNMQRDVTCNACSMACNTRAMKVAVVQCDLQVRIEKRKKWNKTFPKWNKTFPKWLLPKVVSFSNTETKQPSSDWQVRVVVQQRKSRSKQQLARYSRAHSYVNVATPYTTNFSYRCRCRYTRKDYFGASGALLGEFGFLSTTVRR